MGLLDWLLLLIVLAVLGALVRWCRRGPDGTRARGRNALAEPVASRDEEGIPLNGSLSALDRRLRAAGYRGSALSYVAFLLLASGVLALSAGLVFGGGLLPILVAFPLGIHILHAAVVETAKTRAVRFETKLADTLDIMIGALRGGENPTRALATAGEAAPQPVRRELRAIVHKLNLGMPIGRAVSGMLLAYDSEGVRMFCSTLVAKWVAGGDLAPVLASISRIIHERLRHRMRLKSQLAGARLSALFVAIMPYILLLGFHWKKPGWLDNLLLHPVGPPLLFSAVCLQIAGFLWLNKIVRSEL